jgi:hypothetical protein
MTMLEPDEGWMAGLSPSSREVADAVALKRTMRLDLVGLVAAWVGSVRVIARDTGDKYYEDYACYLGWREILDEVLAAVPETDAAVIRHAIEPADTAFRDHTVDDGGEALSRKLTVRTDRWYWRRVPVDGPIARSLGTAEAQ